MFQNESRRLAWDSIVLGIVVAIILFFNSFLWERSRIARQQSEQKYRKLLEQSSDAFLLLDHLGHCREVNRQACQCLGYKQSEMLDLHFEQFLAEVNPRDLSNSIS